MCWFLNYPDVRFRAFVAAQHCWGLHRRPIKIENCSSFLSFHTWFSRSENWDGSVSLYVKEWTKTTFTTLSSNPPWFSVAYNTCSKDHCSSAPDCSLSLGCFSPLLRAERYNFFIFFSIVGFLRVTVKNSRMWTTVHVHILNKRYSHSFFSNGKILIKF
jgi:hypothetical protein